MLLVCIAQNNYADEHFLLMNNVVWTFDELFF